MRSLPEIALEQLFQRALIARCLCQLQGRSVKPYPIPAQHRLSFDDTISKTRVSISVASSHQNCRLHHHLQEFEFIDVNKYEPMINLYVDYWHANAMSI